MRFLSREIGGWLLVLLGIYCFLVSFEFLRTHHVVEAGLPSFIGIIVFRGGIHLLKVAIAARVCADRRANTKTK